MYYFCTYFDQNYLSRFFALHHSLTQHVTNFCLWALCMDNTAYQIMQQKDLPNVLLISLEEFEKDDLELQSAKQNRSMVEYYFTCTPSLPLYILRHNPEIDLITYLDADLYFYADISPIFEEIGDHSIAIIEHRFPTHLQYLNDRGIYNVAWLSFRRDDNGMSCLKQWRNQCIDWCYDIVEENRYADQKYLDKWPEEFSNLIIIKHKGANLAPWNVQNYQISSEDEHIMVNDQPLIFYHFQGLKQTKSWLLHSGFLNYELKPTRIIRRLIYARYVRRLMDDQLFINRVLQVLPLYTGRDPFQPLQANTSEKWMQRIKNLFNGEYIIYLFNQVIY